MERILSLLEGDARLSAEEIGRMLDMTTQQVASKIDEYTKAHIINGYRTLVDWELAGVTRVQALIELRVSPRR
ncbi:MAG: AsnC family transcriptional regulator, partial [Oscillospiraceae bacterium]